MIPRPRPALLAACLAACAPAGPPPVAPAPVVALPSAVVLPSRAPAPPPPSPPAAAPHARRWPPPPPSARSAFCLEGVLQTLDQDACYVLPDRPATTLLIYLPGLMPPGAGSPEQVKVEHVVAAAARRAGIAALVPRGVTRDAMAAPARDAKGMGGWISWPTGDESYRRFARTLVDRILARRRALEALVGGRFERVYLGGSSAGAYFVAHLAVRGDFPADGFAVISGGSARPSRRLSDLPRRPIYIGYGDGDTVGAKAEDLAREARAAGWDVKVSVHHTGHGSREFYLDEAFAFFNDGGRAPQTPREEGFGLPAVGRTFGAPR